MVIYKAYSGQEFRDRGEFEDFQDRSFTLRDSLVVKLRLWHLACREPMPYTDFKYSWLEKTDGIVMVYDITD